jgi:hypothetical protein
METLGSDVHENILVGRQHENVFIAYHDGPLAVHLDASLTVDPFIEVGTHNPLFCFAAGQVNLELCWLWRKVNDKPEIASVILTSGA